MPGAAGHHACFLPFRGSSQAPGRRRRSADRHCLPSPNHPAGRLAGGLQAPQEMSRRGGTRPVLSGRGWWKFQRSRVERCPPRPPARRAGGYAGRIHPVSGAICRTAAQRFRRRFPFPDRRSFQAKTGRARKIAAASHSPLVFRRAMGMRKDCPSSVSSYSTRGGTSG